MSIGNMFSWSYWFAQPLIAVGNVRLFWIISALVFVVIGIIFRLVKYISVADAWKRMLYRIGVPFALYGIGMMIWFVCRQQGVFLFSFRFWLILGFGLLVYRTYRVVCYVTKRIPEIKKEQARRELINKYLPRPHMRSR